jgi:hypothetical protein
VKMMSNWVPEYAIADKMDKPTRKRLMEIE